MEPDPEPAGPGATELPEVEHEGAGDPRSARPFLAWSAEEVAEWVVQLGFPQYEVRDCPPPPSAPPEPVAVNSVCV